MKAVLPAAGFGTRFLPLSKAVPKELLPLGAKPVIQYVAEEAVAAGFEEILIILSRDKESIRRYFEPAPGLEASLEKRGKLDELALVRSVSGLANFHFAYQPDMLGLGDAILQARDFCGRDPFAVLLADTVIHGPSPLPALRSCLESLGTAAVALESCHPDRVGRYGIAGGREESPGRYFIDSMVEKPGPDSVPRMLASDGTGLPAQAFAARYLFTPAIFPALAECRPGKNGEVQLTDAMESLRKREGFHGVRMEGRRLDIGNPRGLMEAFPLFAAA
ncbi:MAG: sugar phosphate nucleotidyltransferase [Candidatus Methylacidiphilales bacterium]|nr:sugar phosphate nucleotidyltransferase [Candidatus Methylacidiphilales bacterium]